MGRVHLLNQGIRRDVARRLQKNPGGRFENDRRSRRNQNVLAYAEADIISARLDDPTPSINCSNRPGPSSATDSTTVSGWYE